MTTKIKPKDFCVRRGAAVDLSSLRTAIDPFYASKEDDQAILNKQMARHVEQQELFYARGRRGLLPLRKGLAK